MHLMKIILEFNKKKTKSNACMKIFDLPKILQDQHFSPMYHPADPGCRRLYVHMYMYIVHILRATSIQNQSLNVVFFFWDTQ